MPDITPLRQCLVINPDGTTHLVTAHRPADFALGVLGKFDIALGVLGKFDIATCPDRRHVLAVGEASVLDNEPINPVAWLAYGRSMLHGTAVLWHDTDNHIDPQLITMLRTATPRALAAAQEPTQRDAALTVVFQRHALPYWQLVAR